MKEHQIRSHCPKIEQVPPETLLNKYDFDLYSLNFPLKSQTFRPISVPWI